MSPIELIPHAPSSPLSRDLLPVMLAAVSEPGSGDVGSWNVVDTLDMLIDAGHYRSAQALANIVKDLVGEGERQRLFAAYGAFCKVMIEGTFGDTLELLEDLYDDISSGNHSTADKVRGGLVCARTLILGAATSALSETSLSRARSILNSEFCRAVAENDPQLACLVGLELARSYLLCSPHEIVVLSALAAHLRDIARDERVSGELRFDIQRISYHLLPHSKSEQEAEVACEDLRRMAVPLGSVCQGLAELAISRRTDVSEQSRSAARTKALAHFEEYRYVSGIFEILHTEGADALAERSNEQAARSFAQAAHLADESGCSYGTVLASLGALRASLAANTQDVSHHVDRMRALMCADIALGAAGLGTVAAMQVVGRVDDAVKVAQRCEKFFRERGLDALESQAVFMVGSAHALIGRWGKAKTAWRRGVSVDIRRRSPLAVADKQAALAQAMAMEDFSRDSSVSAAVMSKVERLLAAAERNTASCGDTVEAVRARAKILQTHAQLCMIAQRPVDAVKYLSNAREQYALRRLDRDVALSDALLGLALLELAKTKGGRLYEESIAALQRSLEFFAATQHAHIRWKLKYYLAIAAFMSSRTRSEAGYRNQWMRTASAWLEGALEDVSIAKAAGGNAALDGDFSPGLGVQALESLSQALRKGPRTNRPRLLRLAPRGKRPVRQIH